MKRFICIMVFLALLFGLSAQFLIRADVQEMRVSAAFVEILKVMEAGVSPTFPMYPYWDYAQYSIGYGTRCPDDKLEYYKKYGITQQEAEALLYAELPEYEAAVKRFAQEHGLSFMQQQFDALVSFTYNCGSAWTYDTEGYFNTAVREGKTGSAFLYGICLWSTAGGDYILTKRRMSEANMYLNGVYEACNDSSDGTYPDTFKYIYLDGNGGTSHYTIHGYDASDPVDINIDFSAVPTGDGFTYEFAGWFTAPSGGEQVELLDGSLPDGTVLYAQWKNPAGEIIPLPKGEPCAPVRVSALETVNIRSGPGTFYAKLGQLQQGNVITITQTFTQSGKLWGEFENGWVSLEYTDYYDVIWPRTGKVNGDDVNVRSGPGTNHPVQYQMNMGDAVTIHERRYDGTSLYWGRLTDGNWICLTYITLDPVLEDSPIFPDGTTGDMNSSGGVDKDDAIYLLRHVVYPQKYPLTTGGDINGNGVIDKDDAIYLLRHVVYPEKYPLGG